MHNSAEPGDFRKTMSQATAEDEIDLRKWVALLVQNYKLGVGVAVVIIAYGWFQIFMIAPTYQTDALIQIGRQQPSYMGEMAGGTGSSAGDFTFAGGQPEIDVMRSRSVLGRAVQNAHLEIHAEPSYFPTYGAALVRHHLGRIFRFLGSQYAWEDVRIDLEQLEVPQSLSGNSFILRTGKGGQYSLLGSDGKNILVGMVGKTASAPLGDGVVTLLVRALDARPGVEFFLTSDRMEDAVQNLQGSLDISMKNREPSMIEIVMNGSDPIWITKALNAVVNAYIQQNVELHSEQSSKSLEFLEQQLPDLRQQLTAAEGALQAYKSKKGTVIDVGEEGRSVLEQAKDVDTKIADLKLQRSELKTRFTDASPAVKTIDMQLEQLNGMKDKVDDQLKKIPQAELDTVRLTRDVQGTSELYTRLLNRAQELKVAKAGVVGDARIIDVALQPEGPSGPNIGRMQATNWLFAIVAGLAAIFAKVYFNRTLDTPETIEAELGLPIFATIPHSDAERKAKRTTTQGHVLQLLCRTSPDDAAVEGLRSLRTSLQFAAFEAKNNIVAIHGPTPGIGKSFVATNLAFLIADAGKSTLLIDADMRQGHIHKTLTQERSPGLSEVISGAVKLDHAARPLEDGKLTFLSTGDLPPNPSELLAHGNFHALLQNAPKTFDFVVIDTPPTLNLADSISIGKQAGVNFLVVRGGVSTLQDVRIAQRRMEQNGIRIDGIIFNDLSSMAASYGYGSYYSYKYKPGAK